jgi:spore germination protein YaaH
MHRHASMRPRVAVPLLVAVVGLGFVGVGLREDAAPPAPPVEGLWYMVNSEESIRSFLDNVDRVSILAPQAFQVDARGQIRGGVDERVLEAARDHRIRVMPLVYQSAFDARAIQALLRYPRGRQRAVAEMARLCRLNRFWGLQFDFENIHISDRDLFTSFYREAAEALHRVGCAVSIAVVPRTGDTPGDMPYHRWLHEQWRGVYDYRALAAAGDFMVAMSYDQHTRYTPPGPVAGLPWVERTVAYLLAHDVPPGKILLGVPAYSRIWSPIPGASADSSAPRRGLDARGLSYPAARDLIRRHDARLSWDERNRSYFASWENDGTNEYLAVENAETFTERLKLVRKYNLRGFAVWRLGQEDPRIWRLVHRNVPVRK